jgi:hypothetical protein
MGQGMQQESLLSYLGVDYHNNIKKNVLKCVNCFHSNLVFNTLPMPLKNYLVFGALLELNIDPLIL